MAASDNAHRAVTLAGSAVLVVGSLGVAFLARGPLGLVGTGEADTPDVGLVLAAVPLLALAVAFVSQGIGGVSSSLAAASARRFAAAALLVAAVLPFDQLGPLGWVGNVGMAVAAVVVLGGTDGDRDERA